MTEYFGLKISFKVDSSSGTHLPSFPRFVETKRTYQTGPDGSLDPGIFLPKPSPTFIGSVPFVNPFAVEAHGYDYLLSTWLFGRLVSTRGPLGSSDP